MRRRSSTGIAFALFVSVSVATGVVVATVSSIRDAATVTAPAWRVSSGGSTPPPVDPVVPPPGDAPFDYQIGGDYEPATGVTVISRDWFSGSPLDDGYSICYVNAFQTQPDDDGSRPDERSNWPKELVLTGFEDDPNWDGEYLIDISTSDRRLLAADHLDQMIGTCADKGFDAVEYDNLDSWMRLDDLPFDRSDTIAFAELIADRAHALGLAVGQKNTAELLGQRKRIGFDFVVVEECGEFDECRDFTAVYDDRVVAIEYSNAGFATACRDIGDDVSVVRRDVQVTRPGSRTYVYREC